MIRMFLNKGGKSKVTHQYPSYKAGIKIARVIFAALFVAMCFYFVMLFYEL